MDGRGCPQDGDRGSPARVSSPKDKPNTNYTQIKTSQQLIRAPVVDSFVPVPSPLQPSTLALPTLRKKSLPSQLRIVSTSKS